MDLIDGQKSFLDLRRGLFLIRYDSAEDGSNPPRLVISPEGWAPSDLEIILPPDADEPVLWSPGGCLAVRAGRPGRLTLQSFQHDLGGRRMPRFSWCHCRRIHLAPIDRRLKYF